MNWLPKPSAFDYAQQQSARRRATAKSFIARQESIAASLGSISSVTGQSAVEMHINNAINRLKSKMA